MSHRSSFLGIPAVDAVDLVGGDHERCARLAQDAEGLERLRLATLHDVDDQDGDVRQRSPAGSQGGERVVAGCVDEQQTG